jgi:hypothetical protein
MKNFASLEDNGQSFKSTCKAQGHEERAEDGDDRRQRDSHLGLDQLDLSAPTEGISLKALLQETEFCSKGTHGFIRVS